MLVMARLVRAMTFKMAVFNKAFESST